MRVRIHTCIPAVAAIIAGSAMLTACNDDNSSSDAAPSASQTTSAPAAVPSDTASEPDATVTTTAPDDSSGGGTSAAVTVNKSFTDDVMGDKATIIKYVDNYQPSAAAKSKYSALEDEKVVLVDVKVTASSKYYDSFGADSFYLTGMSNGIDQASTTILDDEIKAAGYPPLTDASEGKTTTGWVVFTPDKDTKRLVLRYKRLAATTSDGKTITAKNFDTALD